MPSPPPNSKLQAPSSPLPALPFLGIRFWNGETDTLLQEMDTQGGVLTVPSAPSLAEALQRARRGMPLLLEAYRASTWAVVDGGYIALILRWVLRRKARRISGLQLIERLFADVQLAVPMRERNILWVVPNQKEGERIARFLESADFSRQRQSFYEAPYYKAEEDFDDAVLQEVVRTAKPDWVVICIGGGRQEKVAHFLQRGALEKWEGAKVARCESEPEAESSERGALEEQEAGGSHRPGRGDRSGDQRCESDPLSSSAHCIRSTADSAEGDLPTANGQRPTAQDRLPAILCTGAAIAFFTGGQARIPAWADRLYLGWLFRIVENPRLYGKRYGQALFLLPWMLWKFRGEV